MCSTLVSEGDLGLHSDGDNVRVCWQCAGDGWVDMSPGGRAWRDNVTVQYCLISEALGSFIHIKLLLKLAGQEY